MVDIKYIDLQAVSITFMKEVHRQGIDYHISETDFHNRNPAEGVIREAEWKWYHNIVKKRVPRQIWDYGVSWVSEVMPMNVYSENYSNVGITQKM